MNGNEEFKLGEKLGSIEGEQKVMHTKLDNIQNAVNSLAQGLGSRVQEHDKQIARVEIETKNNKDHVGWVSKKVDRNIGIAGAIIIAMIGLAVKLIKG